MSRNPYLAASRPSSSYTRSSRTSSRTGGASGTGGLLGRSRSSATLGNLASAAGLSSSSGANPFGSTLSTTSSYVPQWQRSSSSTRLGGSTASRPLAESSRETVDTTRRSAAARPSLYRTPSTHSQNNDSFERDPEHLKNYQDSKYQQQQQQQQQTNPQQERTTRSSRSSLGSSFDSDIGQQTSSTSQSDYNTTTRNRSTASLDSSGDNESVGDNIPSASARHLRSQQQQQQQLGHLSKSKSLEITSANQQQDEPSSLLYSSMSVDRLLLRADSMGERDLRKSFKELVVENERLKQQLKGFDDKDKQRQQDWIRKERQLHRKISELEEENKQVEQWKLEIQRLKDENNSLIRVVSKLTKQNH